MIPYDIKMLQLQCKKSVKKDLLIICNEHPELNKLMLTLNELYLQQDTIKQEVTKVVSTKNSLSLNVI